MRILICGLPGSGKTTLATNLKLELINRNCSVAWFNADLVRKEFDDWDFSDTGRLRQARRMGELSINSSYDFDYVISDFVAPTEEIRTIFNGDMVIFMDTIVQGRFSDTNAVFEKPINYDLKLSDFNYSISDIVDNMLIRLYGQHIDNH